VFITDKAAAVVLLAYLIVEPYNRQAAGFACVAGDASYAKFSGGFWQHIHMRCFASLRC